MVYFSLFSALDKEWPFPWHIFLYRNNWHSVNSTCFLVWIHTWEVTAPRWCPLVWEWQQGKLLCFGALSCTLGFSISHPKKFWEKWTTRPLLQIFSCSESRSLYMAHTHAEWPSTSPGAECLLRLAVWLAAAAPVGIMEQVAAGTAVSHAMKHLLCC